MSLDMTQITQMVFSVGVSWYLLVVNSKKQDALAKGILELSAMIKEIQRESVLESREVKEMFTEIKELIKETSNLVHTTSESVRIQNELTKRTLDRLDRQ